MKHVIFDLSAGCVTAATAFRDAWDARFGYPRGSQDWNQHFADPLLNNAARANPSAVDARAAIDVSCGFALAGGDYDSEEAQVFILDMLDTSPLPTGAVVEDIDPNDAEWAVPFGGP